MRLRKFKIKFIEFTDLKVYKFKEKTKNFKIFFVDYLKF